MGARNTMAGIETNIFPFLNLEDLSSNYRLYHVKGLNHGNSVNKDEGFKRENALVRRLSYQLQTPVTTIRENDKVYLVVRDDRDDVPGTVDVVRTKLYLEPIDEVFHLDYGLRSPNNDRICLKFLQFILREPLSQDSRLWSPGAGQPFFNLSSVPVAEEILMHRGFRVRVVPTHDDALGVAVDVSHKYVEKRPLPVHLSRQDFRRLGNRHLIYHFGHKWYEIRPEFLDELNVSESTIDTPEGIVSLIDFIYKQTQKPFPDEIAELPNDASVLGYKNNRGEQRGAPAALCYRVYNSRDRVMKKLHRRSVLDPEERRRAIHSFVRENLKSLRFGRTKVEISEKALAAPSRKFFVPDIEFGNKHVLSVRGTEGAQHVSLDNLGNVRFSLLKEGPGFFDTSPLRDHYVFLPLSVSMSYGETFVKDLKDHVDRFFPQEFGYDPHIVVYDDRCEKIWPEQAAAIKKAAERDCKTPGYAVVMIHKTEDWRLREEDTLAAATVRELQKLNVYGSVIHVPSSKEFYEVGRGSDGIPHCSVRRGMGTRLSGYLQIVALNKVLLNDFRRPFNLSTDTHADITIGIDVKNHTAGFVIVADKGRKIRFDFDFDQSESEKISFKRMKKCTIKLLFEEMEYSQNEVSNIIFQRDGRFYESERDGIKEAVEHLKSTGVLPRTIGVTFLEIHKKSQVPFRLFEVATGSVGRPQVWNPQVGFYYIANSSDAYLCSTGRAFAKHRHGTVRPLHVRYLEGPMPFEHCIEDVYFFTALAWTNPRDCSREPITIKLTDRYLGEEAGSYNINELSDALQTVKEARA
jgi:hypothetical protein